MSVVGNFAENSCYMEPDRRDAIIDALEEGEASGDVEDFGPEAFIEEMKGDWEAKKASRK